jgi:hypothetical protein
MSLRGVLNDAFRHSLLHLRSSSLLSLRFLIQRVPGDNLGDTNGDWTSPEETDWWVGLDDKLPMVHSVSQTEIAPGCRGDAREYARKGTSRGRVMVRSGER